MTDSRMATCPWCLYVTNTMTYVGEEPGDGPAVDISICAECGMPAIIDDEAIGGLRRPSDIEHVELAANRLVIAMMAAWFEATGRPLPEDDL